LRFIEISLGDRLIVETNIYLPRRVLSISRNSVITSLIRSIQAPRRRMISIVPMITAIPTSSVTISIMNTVSF
jgi:hypothetical protein